MNVSKRTRVAYLVSTNKVIPIHEIHSAGETYCVSGDRRLRELRQMFIRECGHDVSYSYTQGPPKRYFFYSQFRNFCRRYYVAHRRELIIPQARVHSTQGDALHTKGTQDAGKGTCRLCSHFLKDLPVRGNRVYCSAKCRAKAYRMKNEIN